MTAPPVPGTPPPVLATTTIQGQTRSVVRFSGKELLQAPRSALPIGSLFVVFRADKESSRRTTSFRLGGFFGGAARSGVYSRR